MTPITLPLSELKPALTGLGKIINRNATSPVLQCLRIERTPDGWVCLTATDLERYVTVRLEQPAEGEPMVLLAHYGDLAQVVKTCSRDQSFQLEPASPKTVNLRFKLVGHLGASKIKSLPVEEYPEVPKIKGNSVALPDALRRALQEAMECTSKDEARYILQGALIDVSQPQAHYVVATDGRHLYSCNSFQLPLEHSLVIPRHKFLAWRDFQLDGDWQLKLPDPADSAGPDQRAYAQISTRRWRFITALPASDYPNWRQVMPDPKETQTTVEFDPDLMDSVIRTIDLLADHDDEFHSFGLEWRGGQISFLYQENPGNTWHTIPVTGARGKGKEVTAFCSRLLLLKALRFGLHTVSIIDECTALRFADGGRQMIIMPVRVNATAKAPSPVSEPVPAPASGPRPLPPPNESEVQRQPQTPRNTHPMNTPAINHHPVPPTTSTQPPEPPAPRVEEALEILEVLRDTCTKTLGQIKDLTLKLRLIQRGQRSSEREIQTVSQTLRSLQGIRF